MSNVYNDEMMANNNQIEKYRKVQLKTIILAVCIIPVLLIFVHYSVSITFFFLAIGVFFHYENKIKDFTKRNSDIVSKAYPDPENVINDYQSNNYGYSSSNNHQYQKDHEPQSRFGHIEYPHDQKNSLEIIIAPEIKNSINKGIGKIKHREFLYKNWNLQSIDQMDSKNIFNFYGPPGTGKTISAKEVAKILNKKLFIVKYDQVESKMVGETEKNIASVFKFAKENDAIIFLDEADALVSQRVESTSANGQYLNAAKNVFMQELDRFNGLMILTTNHFHSFDPALLRRISQHIAFELPNQEMRLKLFKAHIPQEVTVDKKIDFNKLSLLTNGFSGGDIKNVTREAMTMAINQADQLGDITKSCLTEDLLIAEIKNIKRTKKDYFNEKEVKTIGISSQEKD